MESTYIDDLLARCRSGALTEIELVIALLNAFDEGEVEAAFTRLSPELRGRLRGLLTRVAKGGVESFSLGPAARARIKAYVASKHWSLPSCKCEVTLEWTIAFLRQKNVSLPRDIRFVLTEDIGGASHCLFGGWIGPRERRIKWSSLYRGEFIPIAIHPEALETKDIAVKTVLTAVYLFEEISKQLQYREDFPVGELVDALSASSVDGPIHRASASASQWARDQVV